MSLNVYSVCKGIQIPIEEVNDAVFSQKMVGDGAAVIPDGNYIYAPVDGTVETIFPSKHAFIIKNRECCLMIHIGIDTVKLNGAPFTLLIHEGDKIKRGTPIAKVDYSFIEKQNVDKTVLLLLIEQKIERKFTETEYVDKDTILFCC